MNSKSLAEAFKLASISGVTAGLVTATYGFATKDYSQIVPAVVFSFGTAMGIAGYYDRRAHA